MKPRLTSETSQGPIKLAIYGASGSGKTSLARTLPGKPIIISAESGLLSLSDSAIPYLSVSERDIEKDGKTIVEAIPKGIERAKRLGEIMAWLATDEAKKQYDTIFIDSVTEIAENLVDTYKTMHAGTKKEGFGVWMDYSEKLVSWMKTIRDDAHYNAVLVFLEELEKDENGRRYHGPEVPGQAAKKFILPAFDIILRLAVADDEARSRYMVTGLTATEKAKSRGVALDLIERHADLGIIFEKIRATSVRKIEEKAKETKNV